MTLTPSKYASRVGSSLFWQRLGVCYMCLFLIILFFKNSQAASAWVSRGLELCAKKLIPSLFPFMVISSLIVLLDVGKHIFAVFKKPFSALFGISSDAVCALCLGWLCGFPVGAKCAGALYDSGRISLGEYKKTVCISSTPSPAFLIGTVGGSMLGSVRAGILIYTASVAASILLGIGLNFCVKDDGERVSGNSAPRKRPSFSEALTRSVADSAVDMLKVCAFIVFFSAFLGAIEQLLDTIYLSDTLEAIIFSAFELTSGTARICELGANSCLALASAAAGWSGLSVHFQIMTICNGRNLKFNSYFIFHLLKCALCFTLVAFLT